MRRAPALFVVVGVVASMADQPVHAKQTQTESGFWVSLASGLAGSSSSSDYNEFFIESPHAPSIAVTSTAGAGTIQATTAGGNSFFTSAGTPVLLPTTDGYATLSSGSSFPSSALPRFAGGSEASGAPQAGGSIPSSADKLSLTLSSPAANGSEVLSVSVTSPGGTALGQTNVNVPSNGWWVVGLGNGSVTTTTTTPPPVGGTGTTTPPPTTGSSPPGGSSGGGTAATPEPSTMMLFGFGGLTLAGWRMRRR
jgi:hypothetical protein